MVYSSGHQQIGIWPGTNCAGFRSSQALGVGGQSYSNCPASTVAFLSGDSSGWYRAT